MLPSSSRKAVDGSTSQEPVGPGAGAPCFDRLDVRSELVPAIEAEQLQWAGDGKIAQRGASDGRCARRTAVDPVLDDGRLVATRSDVDLDRIERIPDQSGSKGGRVPLAVDDHPQGAGGGIDGRPVVQIRRPDRLAPGRVIVPASLRWQPRG